MQGPPLNAFILAILLLSPAVNAATLQGTAYDLFTLDPLPDTIITLNTTPEQTFVAKNAVYSFDVEPGTYTLHAVYKDGAGITYTADENVRVTSEGTYTIDLILSPSLDELEDLTPPGDVPSGQSPTDNFMLLTGAIILLLGAGGLYAFYRMRTRVQKENATPPSGTGVNENTAPSIKEEKNPVEEKLDEYALEVLDVLKRSGNRLTQKEIREKITRIGEAKISLILSELEELGYLKKIKKGRGNIVVLKEKGLAGENQPLKESQEDKAPQEGEQREPPSLGA
ncbi:MAG: hypothetical protein HY393_04570 [Candidatus Diapherotrites archaeon]|nr:hypothetical protein [Candidatus Diapherotrites archaeon]